MIQRRTPRRAMKVRIGCHTFRATGITVDLEARGTLENAQAMATHESPRTTKLYDRSGETITLDEVEKITIQEAMILSATAPPLVVHLPHCSTRLRQG
jgi:hypothetical protein